jgi:glycogen synthase
MFFISNVPAPPLFYSIFVFRSKVGGLADVLASLPTALAARYIYISIQRLLPVLFST